jgi:hypothetical protein
VSNDGKTLGAKLLGAIHFFVVNQGRILMALDECDIDGYTVKHPEGALHGSSEDPWTVRLDDKRVCDFFVDARESGLNFKVRVAKGYERVLKTFELLTKGDDDKPPPGSHLN